MAKDVDMMRDTGGTYKHKDLQKPSRSDRKNHGLSEKDPDSKDTKRDPDLKMSSIVKKIMASEFMKLYQDKDVVFMGYKGNEKKPDDAELYTVYKNGFIEIFDVSTETSRTLGSHPTQILNTYKLPEFEGWDDDTGLPILNKNHNKKPEDDLDETVYSLKKTYHDDNDRYFREEFIEQVLGNDDEVVFIGYRVNKNNRYQHDICVVKKSGVIQVYNPELKKVTTKISRPQQIVQVYALPEYIGWDKNLNKPILRQNHGKVPLSEVMEQCGYYEQKDWNHDDSLPFSHDRRQDERNLLKNKRDDIMKNKKSKIAKELIKIAKLLVAYDSKIFTNDI